MHIYQFLFLRDRFVDRRQIDWDHLMFSDLDLKKLLIPLIIENLLTNFMGMADSVMVARIGSAAISAVTLTDAINQLITQLFAAMATGGTILCAQYLGASRNDKANDAAKQVVLSVTAVSVLIALFFAIWNRPVLMMIFGSVEPAVMNGAVTYMAITAASIPFIGLYQAGAAFFRAAGNSRIPMQISSVSNILNIIGNAILIFGFHQGIAGAAIATLVSRVFSAVVIFIYLRIPAQDIVIRDILKIRPDMRLILKILAIGIPSGIENSMFQFGKLAVQSAVSTLGTMAIAANAMTILFEGLNGVGGIAVGVGLTTVVGQCIGAGRTEEAKYYSLKLLDIGQHVIEISCLICFLLHWPVMWFADLEGEAAGMFFTMLCFISIIKPILWAPGAILVNAFRGAGDVNYVCIFSTLSMWFLRVLMVTVLIRVYHMGPMAVWIGMTADWLARSIAYTIHFLRGKWIEQRVI